MNFEAHLYNKDVVEAKKKGLKVSNYTSLNVIIFLDFVNKKFLKADASPKYKITTSGRGKNKTTINHNEIAAKHILQLNTVYEDEYNALNAKKLGFQYIYVLHHIYHIIFKFDEENRIISSSDKYKFNSSMVKIQECYKKITKILKYQRNIDVFSEQFSEQSIDLLKFIIKNT